MSASDSHHNFIESDPRFDKYMLIIYCTWCGVVVWNFNRNDESISVLQTNAATACNANKESVDE